MGSGLRSTYYIYLMTRLFRLIILSLVVGYSIDVQAESGLFRNDYTLRTDSDYKASLRMDLNWAQSAGGGRFAPFWFTSLSKDI